MSGDAHFFLIAGEASGDQLGAALMAGLKELHHGQVRFSGVGGPAMQAEGLRSLFAMDELSVMGMAEVLPRLPRLLRRISQTTAAVLAAKPDVLITIDSPDFCLRVAKRVKPKLPDLAVVHYVAPSVWAWRPGRAAKMARYVDHVLALLPFEPEYMRAAGMSCDFVGHPIAATPEVSAPDIKAFRAALGLSGDQKLVCLLPGSRRGEVARLAPVFRAVAERLLEADPRLRFVIPSVAARVAQIREIFDGSATAPIILDPKEAAGTSEAQKRIALKAADLALAASGTVSLELAAAGTPMVIAYDGNPLSVWLARRFIKLKSPTLVNILTDSQAVPDYLFEACNADQITPAMMKLLADPKAATGQRLAGSQAMVMLGRGGEAPGLRAARSVLGFLETRR